MKFTEITFHQLFPTGEYANQRLETKISLDIGDDPIEAFVEAKKMVGEAFKKINPISNEPFSHIFNPVPPLQSIDYKAKEKLEIDIDNATTIEQLNALEEEASKLGLRTHLVAKHNSLVLTPKTPM